MRSTRMPKLVRTLATGATAAIVLYLSVTACSGNARSSPRPPRAVNGILDLRTWQFERDGPVRLDGEWEFHWKELGPSGLPTRSPNSLPNKKQSRIKVPSSWKGHELNGRALGGQGYATYRLKILINQHDELLAFRTVEMRSAFELRINGKTIAGAGRVAKNRESMRPRWHPTMGYFLPRGRTLNLTVRISNFNHPTGGIRKSILMGTPDRIRGIREGKLNQAFFLSGTLFIIGLSYLAFFVLRRVDPAPLYFCIICLLVAMRTLLIDERYLHSSLPGMPWDILLKLEYLTFYLVLPTFTAFTYSIFPAAFSRKARDISLVIGAGCALLVLALRPLHFYYTLPIMQLSMILMSLYVYYVLISEARKGRLAGILFLAGFSVLGITGINDILNANSVIATGNFASAGLMFFIFSQSILLAARLSKALSTAEDLTHKLEERVARRTEQLSAEKETSEKLLLNILPRAIADELKEKGAVDPHHFESVTILFADLKGFTRAAATMPPEELVRELNRIFLEFDKICDRHGIEKLKTIGDAYMCAGGIPDENRTHAVDVCLAALEMRAYMREHRDKPGTGKSRAPAWELRIGIHTGAVMAGVIGKNKFAYDLWGDTVNVASRCESSGEPGRINISAAVNRAVKTFFACEHRGRISAKGKGKLNMYFLDTIKPRLAEDETGMLPNDAFKEKYARLELKP